MFGAGRFPDSVPNTREARKAFHDRIPAPLALKPASKDLLLLVVTKSGKQINHFLPCLASIASDSTLASSPVPGGGESVSERAQEAINGSSFELLCCKNDFDVHTEQ